MRVLLHICCSNCAIYPVRILRQEGHNLTGFWFNPNIHPRQEYNLRLESFKKLANDWHIEAFYTDEYNPQEYFKMFSIEIEDLDRVDLDTLKTFPDFPERCKSCYRLRLEKTAIEASRQGFDAFSTTLLISPYQDFDQIVNTGKKLAEKYNVFFYLKDFRPYFRDSKVLSKELGLYRQKYCGCIYSMKK